MHGGSNMAQDSAPEPTPAVNVRHDDFVAQVNPDPTTARGGTVLAGFIGKGAAAGDLRVYGDHSLTSWVDVPADAVLHAVELPAASSPLGGSVLWVKSDAKLTPSGSAAPQFALIPTVLTPHQPTFAPGCGISTAQYTCAPHCGVDQTASNTCPPGCGIGQTASNTCPPGCIANLTHPVACWKNTAPPVCPPQVFTHICMAQPEFAAPTAACPQPTPTAVPTQHAAVCPTPATVCTQFGCPQPTPTAIPTQHAAVCPTPATVCTQFGCPQPTPTAIPTQHAAVCPTPATVCTQFGCPQPTPTAIPTQHAAVCPTPATVCTQVGCITQQPGCEQTGFVGHCGLTIQPGQGCRQGTFTPFGGG
jgi:hypothetical protein